MTAETLHCPTCGAAISSDSQQCRYCGSRLATVACPSCFGMAFVGSKFCAHCGAELEWPDEGVRVLMRCPTCKVPMNEVNVAHIKLRECGTCCGIWVDIKSFEKICSERENQAAVLGVPNLVPPTGAPNRRAYLPCPQCNQLMNRMQFSRRSGVVLDLCRRHGVWFDRDELRHIVEFIRDGGLDRARQIEKEEIEQ